MEVFKWNGRQFDEVKDILPILQIKQQDIVSVVGAGGKTTLIFYLAEQLRRYGQRVIITTTTHMYRPQSGLVEWGAPEAESTISDMLDHGEIPVVGLLCDGQKIKGIGADSYQKLTRFGAVVLAEADGSRQKPCKIPAPHEPVIFPGTTLTIGVLGADALGISIRAGCHRPAEVAEYLGKSQEENLTSDDVIQIANRTNGMFKTAAGAHFLIINKCKMDRKDIFEYAKNMTDKCDYPVLFVRYQK